MSTQNPPYDRLALLGSAIVQAAITRILFNHPDFLDTRQICDLRNFYASSANLGFWGCSYEFDKSIITSNIHLTPASLNNLAAASFQAYLGAVVLKQSQEAVTKFIEELVAPSLADVKVEIVVDKYAVQLLNEKLKQMTIPLPDWQCTEDKTESVETRFEVKCVIKGKFAAKAKARSIPEGKRKAATLTMNKPARFFTGLQEIRREE